MTTWIPTQDELSTTVDVLDALPDEFLRERNRRIMSLREVAAEIGLSAAALSRFENRETEPRMYVVRAILVWLAET